MIGAIVTLVLALATTACCDGITEKMGIWVPLYSEPNDEYEKMIKLVEANACLKDSFHGTVLTGPRSGPPNITDAWESKLYRNRFQVVSKTNQWTAFGYVYTNYGKRDLKAVLADIDMWLQPGQTGWGDEVQGIWVDAVKNKFTDADKKYYKAISDRIKSYGKIVAFNPGLSVTDCDFIKDAKVDFLNNFENTYAIWKQQQADKLYDCPCKEVTRCLASVHNYDSNAKATDLAQTLKTMANRGYSAMFVTDRVMPKHYYTLPSFWAEMPAAACNVDASKAKDGGEDKGGDDKEEDDKDKEGKEEDKKEEDKKEEDKKEEDKKEEDKEEDDKKEEDKKEEDKKEDDKATQSSGHRRLLLA